jgi:hypothetical protein
MNDGIVFRTKVHFRVCRNGRKRLENGEMPQAAEEPGRLPWVTKLMALAIRFDALVREGRVSDQAELARLGHVSRARVTQIMNLLHLAPDIQEELLFLPRIERGKEPILERHVRPIAAVPDWRKQAAISRKCAAIHSKCSTT